MGVMKQAMLLEYAHRSIVHQLKIGDLRRTILHFPLVNNLQAIEYTEQDA